MPTATLKTWDEVWTTARDNGLTHWNYSRGRQRFRGILDEPQPIGEDPLIVDEQTIRIRYYKIVGEEYVEDENLDVWLKVPKDSGEFPEDFDEWENDRQTKYIEVSLAKLSANRLSRQMASADKLLYRFIDHLSSQLSQRDSLIKELYAKNSELLASKGIGNVWEFLVHPNAEKIIEALGRAVHTGKETSALTEDLRRLAATAQDSKLLGDKR